MNTLHLNSLEVAARSGDKSVAVPVLQPLAALSGARTSQSPARGQRRRFSVTRSYSSVDDFKPFRVF